MATIKKTPLMEAFLTITSLASTTKISESLEPMNMAFDSLYLAASALNQQYGIYYSHPVEYWNQYGNDLNDAITLTEINSAKWFDFLTIVENTSSKWIQPLTIYYPTLLQDPISEDDIIKINNWLRYFFPVKNGDGTINYVEEQTFAVSCYMYSYYYNVDEINQPYSYCKCATQTGDIALHCKTIITGGWVQCNQGSYNCNTTIDCYPKKEVSCWYESPYLHEDSTPILKTQNVATKQTAISKIQANLIMEYTDRRENYIKTHTFKVYDCDWQYVGTKNY